MFLVPNSERRESRFTEHCRSRYMSNRVLRKKCDKMDFATDEWRAEKPLEERASYYFYHQNLSHNQNYASFLISLCTNRPFVAIYNYSTKKGSTARRRIVWLSSIVFHEAFVLTSHSVYFKNIIYTDSHDSKLISLGKVVCLRRKSPPP